MSNILNGNMDLVEDKKMKINKNSILIVGLLVILTSCGNTDGSSSNETYGFRPIENKYYTYGAFYDIKQAYTRNILSDQDIMNMAYWINGETLYNQKHDEIEVDMSKIYPITDLSIETEEKIRKDTYEYLEKQYPGEIDYNKCTIEVYCGNFDGYHAYKINYCIKDDGRVAMEKYVEILNYVFHYPYAADFEIFLWKENV